MNIPQDYIVSSIVLEKKILSKKDFDASNAEVEKIARDNGLEITSTCNDMQEGVRAWELEMPVGKDS